MKKLLKFLILINVIANITASIERSALEELGRRYVTFMQSVGGDITMYEARASEIFAEGVVKIVNDKQILSNRTELLAQLRRNREIAYPCIFTIQKTLCDTDQKVCTVHFTWDSEKMGLYKTIVSLKVDENNQITEIDAVYNTVGTDLHPISDLARKYNEFQQSYGQSEDKNYAEIIEGLFSPGFQKIVNREVKVDGRDSLDPQLKGVRDAVTSWTIDVKEIIPSADNKKCTVRFILRTPDKGNYDVLKVLSSENGITIDKVDEVFDIIE
ncbi:MAG: hypothetical protein ACK4V2_06920 [Pseudomonadota bacterium]|jgi:hypothetical protein|nr:hypothetical protein [Alphaproteobacteria bacterium]